MTYQKWLHYFSVLTAVVTISLIAAGAAVTSTGSGDAVPDWPLSYGSLNPPMVGGIFYEHGHRLIAGLTASLITILAVWLWRKESRVWVKRVGVAAFAAVLIQAVLGGLRVLVISNELLQDTAVKAMGVGHVIPVRITISVVHAFLAQAILCMIFTIALVTSSSWKNSTKKISGTIKTGWIFGAVLVAVVFIQLILGALVRHMEAGLAIPDFPLSFGQLIPPFSNLPNDLNAPFPISQEELKFRVVVHFLHRLTGLCIVFLVFGLVWYIFKNYPKEYRLVRLSGLLMGLVVVQVTLGAVVIWSQKFIPVTVMHVVVGATLLGNSVVFVLWMGRMRFGIYPPDLSMKLGEAVKMQ